MVRLDSLLAERGLYPSRTRAAAAVMAGDVFVGPGRERALKPGQSVAGDVHLEVVEGMPYVSRGGVKLANALDAFGMDVAGRSCVDVGASTGGFTDCLLQRGAARVAAVDVAYGALAHALRVDPRVAVLERVNARHGIDLPFPCDLAVVDVSFISLRLILPPLLDVLGARYDVLAMVKPQFEVGREQLGKGGVVRDAALRRAAIEDVVASVGAQAVGFASSGLPGPKGNRETFVWLADGERGPAPSLDEVEV